MLMLPSRGFSLLNGCTRFDIAIGGQTVTFNVTAPVVTSSIIFSTIVLNGNITEVPLVVNDTTQVVSTEAISVFSTEFSDATSIYADPITVAWQATDTAEAQIMSDIAQSTSSATQSSSATKSSSSTSGTLTPGPHASLSGGGIAGIVVGVLVGLLGLLVGVWFLWRKRRQRRAPQTEADPQKSLEWQKAELEAREKNPRELPDTDVAELQDTQIPVELPAEDLSSIHSFNSPIQEAHERADTSH
jgi:hypothetical protein